MWPFRKSWVYLVGPPKINPKEAAATYLNDLGKKLQIPRKGWRFLLLDFRESDESYRARLEPALKSTWNKAGKAIEIPEGIKSLKDRPLPAGMMDHLKQKVMDEVNPKYNYGHWEEEQENPNYDPNMTFEEAQRLGRERELRRKG